MSTQNSSPDLPITVKVALAGDTRRFKMSLKDVGPSVFENKLRELLAIPPNEKVVFERYSDSAGTFVTLDPENTPVYKQLFRAAKAKLKLRIKATIIENEPPAVVPTAEILPSPPVPTLTGMPSMSSITTVGTNTTELDDAVVKAVNSYCTSTTFTTALRDTVRDEVEKHAEQSSSVPDLIALQKSTADLPAASTSADLLAASVQESRFPFAIYCNNCSISIWETHYHCTICDGGDFDLCTACTAKDVHCDNVKHTLNKREFKDGRITTSDEYIRRSSRICNGCACGMDDNQAVTCEDCKDYDLCIPCLRGSDHGHDPSHQFTRAHESLRLSDKETALLARGRNVRHEALCDNCDNTIYGIRFKCIDCPDYDYCNQCIGKSSELHPTHRFVPIYRKNDVDTLARCNPTATAMHFGVYCDGPICGGLGHGICITGPRYKCAICPDTDFCANCEASPLNKHNATHPLIKLKTPIRSVHVSTMDNNDNQMGDVPEPAPVEKETTTSNAATQVQTIADVKPTKEFAEVIPEKEVEPQAVKTESVKTESVKTESVKTESVKSEDAPALVATFVQDLVADGTVFAPGQRFTQAWCMRNNGTVSWPAGVSVQFVGGDYMFLKSDDSQLNATTTPNEVAPGEQVVFSVNLTATWPSSKRYISYWRLSSPDGTKFGDNIWCHIDVKEPTEETDVKSEKDNFSCESVGDSVRDVEHEFESTNEDNSQASSQMIFPKLPVESPHHSVEDLASQTSDVFVPSSPVESHSTLALGDGDLEECSLHDDESFMTDEEYDVLDASDEEAFEECIRMGK